MEPSHSGSTAREQQLQQRERDRPNANSLRDRDAVAVMVTPRVKSPVLDKAEQKLKEAEVRF